MVLDFHISNSFKCFILYNIIFSTILYLCFSKICDFAKFKSSKLSRFITLSYEYEIVPSASADNINNIAHVNTGVHLIYQHRDAAF